MSLGFGGMTFDDLTIGVQMSRRAIALQQRKESPSRRPCPFPPVVFRPT
jgi:hypothetical protein